MNFDEITFSNIMSLPVNKYENFKNDMEFITHPKFKKVYNYIREKILGLK